MEKGLELLFDYTKFHIGVYLTLAAAYITLATSQIGSILPKLNPKFVWPAVIFIIIAGFAGGVIASSVTQTKSVTVESFLKEQTGPWSTSWFTGKWWTYIEHTSFWMGIACVVLSFAYSGDV
jgi:hypothetical protein